MTRYVFKMPDLGEGTVEAEIVAWHVKVGDHVTEDQVMAEVMTEKAAVEVPAPVTGRVMSLAGAPGDMVPVGAELVVFDTEIDESLALPPAAAVKPEAAPRPPAQPAPAPVTAAVVPEPARPARPARRGPHRSTLRRGRPAGCVRAGRCRAAGRGRCPPRGRDDATPAMP